MDGDLKTNVCRRKSRDIKLLNVCSVFVLNICFEVTVLR